MKAPIVVLEPGDRVLVNLPDRPYLTHQEAADFINQLRERFPGVEFTVVPAAEVVVQPKNRPSAKPEVMPATGELRESVTSFGFSPPVIEASKESKK